MRTTLDIEEDVLYAAKELARERKVSTGKVLSDLARQSLIPRVTYETRNGVPLFPVRPDARPVTLEMVRELMDDDV